MSQRIGSLATWSRRACVLAGLVVMTAAMAQDGLPPDVKADLLQNRIVAAAGRNDYREVLQAIQEYKALGAKFPTPLLYVEARAAFATGDHRRAYKALTDYLKVADRSSEQYPQALELHPRIVKALVPARPKVDLSNLSQTELLDIVAPKPSQQPWRQEGGLRHTSLVRHLVDDSGCVVTWEHWAVSSYYNAPRNCHLAMAERRTFDFRGGVSDVEWSIDPEAPEVARVAVRLARPVQHALRFGSLDDPSHNLGACDGVRMFNIQYQPVKGTASESAKRFTGSPARAGRWAEAHEELGRRCRTKEQ